MRRRGCKQIHSGFLKERSGGMKVQAQRALANPLVIYYYSDTKMIFIVFLKERK